MKKLFTITFIAVLLDQLIKLFVSSNLNLGDSIIIIEDFFSITYAHNFGAAFSILNGSTLFLVLFGILSLNLIYIFFIHNQKLKKFDIITYGILAAGILGNLIDRILLGYVVDYLDFKIWGYDFPIFNLADIFITVSATLIIIIILRGEKDDKNNS